MFPGHGLRAARAGFFAAVCVVLSAGTHLWAGGAPVPHRTLGAAAALVFCGAYALGGRERTLGALLPATFAAQYGLHHLFSWGAADPAVAPVPGEHVHDATSLTMVLGHAIMALLTAFWLDRGEAALCALARRVGARALPALVRAPSLPVAARPVPAPRRVVVPPTEVLRRSIARRGPPRPISA